MNEPSVNVGETQQGFYIKKVREAVVTAVGSRAPHVILCSLTVPGTDHLPKQMGSVVRGKLCKMGHKNPERSSQLDYNAARLLLRIYRDW